MEDRVFEIENGVGEQLTETRLRFKTNRSVPDLPDDMFGGGQILTFAMDCLTDFSIRRDNGDGSLDANINVNFRHPLYRGDTVESINWLIREGRRSRVYGFALYKTIAYDKEDGSYKVCNPPILICDGESTTVVKKVRDEQEKKF